MGIVSTTVFFVFLLSTAVPHQLAGQGKGIPAATSLDQATAAFKAGSAAYTRGDLPAARHAFERAVRLAPTVSAAHAALGNVLLAEGNGAAALHEIKIALTLAPGNPSTLLSLAVAYSTVGQPADSVTTLHQLQTVDPLLTSAAAGKETAIPLASALAATGDPSAASSLLTQAVAASPSDAALTDALGTLQAQQGNYPQAAETLRHAIALDVSLASAYFHLGSVELQSGRPAQAAPTLEHAVSLQPAMPLYTAQLARALVAIHRETDAITLLHTALTRSPPPAAAIDLRYQLALAYQAAEDLPHALPLFAEVLVARPADPEVLTNAGLAHVQTGDAVGGVALYLRALKLSPNDPTLRENLGVGYLQQSNLDEALVQFRAGLSLDPDSPQLHYDLALALKLKDDLTAAIPEFERAAALDPSLPDPPYTLGIIFMQQSRFPEAAASLERALTLRSENGEGWATLGSVYRQMNAPDRAIPALERAIALTPDQPSPHITLAAIRAAQGDRQQAAAERKVAADLTRVAVNRQKANFGVDSGTVLLKRGEFTQAIVQFESAISADPTLAPAHAGLAQALDGVGRKAEAAEERRKAAALPATPSHPTP